MTGLPARGSLRRSKSPLGFQAFRWVVGRVGGLASVGGHAAVIECGGPGIEPDTIGAVAYGWSDTTCVASYPFLYLRMSIGESCPHHRRRDPREHSGRSKPTQAVAVSMPDMWPLVGPSGHR